MTPRAKFRIAASVAAAVVSAALVPTVNAAATAAPTAATVKRAKITKKASTTKSAKKTPAPTTTVPVTAAPTTTLPTAPPVPTLEFSNSCASDVECGMVSAPLDPADPNGEKVRLFVTRRRARVPASRVGVLFVNPGGPGGPTFDLVRNAHLVVSPEVLDRFDILGVDPRGTGRSTALVCPVADAPGSFDLSQRANSVKTYFSAIANACAVAEGRHLNFLDTPTAASDIDAVRIAIGEERISFLGLSYGTFLGATYQLLFPAHTARMILDSAITPTHFGNSFFLDRAAAKEAALDGFLAACSNGQLNPCAFNDGSDLKTKYARLRTAWITQLGPQSDQILDSQIDSLVGYPRNGWPVLGRALQELVATGRPNFRQIASDSQSRDDRERMAPSDTNSDLTNIAINCRDGILPRDVTSYDTLIQRLPQVAPRFSGIAGDLALGALQCLDWPATLLAAPTFRPLGIPTLVIANRFDLTTPLLWSQTLAGDLTAPLLVREGGGHVAVDKSECVRNVVARFLIEAVPGLASNSCPN